MYYKEVAIEFEKFRKHVNGVEKAVENRIHENFRSNNSIVGIEMSLMSLSQVYLAHVREGASLQNILKKYLTVDISCLLKDQLEGLCIDTLNYILGVSEKKQIGVTINLINLEPEVNRNVRSSLISRLRRLSDREEVVVDFLQTMKFSDASFAVTINEKKNDERVELIEYLFEEENLPICLRVNSVLKASWRKFELLFTQNNGRFINGLDRTLTRLHSSISNLDDAFSDLDRISSRRNSLQDFTNSYNNRYPPIMHSNEFVESIFGSIELKDEYRKYHIHLETLRLLAVSERRQWTVTTQSLIDRLCLSTTNLSEEEKKKLDSWRLSENAFNSLIKGDLDCAYRDYLKLIDENYLDQRHIWYYRIGEIELAKGNEIEAIYAFDECDRVCQNTNEVSIEFLVQVNLVLAFVFWSMGREYVGHSIRKLEYADEICNKLPDEDSRKELVPRIVNSLCWYELESFITEFENNDELTPACEVKYQACVETYNRLTDIMKKVGDGWQLSSNAFDTAAWFCFYSQKYFKKKYISSGLEIYKSKADDFLKSSVDACGELEMGRRNTAPSSLISEDHQRRHIEEIMRAYKRMRAHDENV